MLTYVLPRASCRTIIPVGPRKEGGMHVHLTHVPYQLINLIRRPKPATHLPFRWILGNVRYGTIAHQGRRQGKIIQSQFKHLVFLAHRKDFHDEQLIWTGLRKRRSTTAKARQASGLLWLRRFSFSFLISYTNCFYSLLPQPIHTSSILDDEAEIQQQVPSQAVVTRTPIPPYGKRKGWKPTSQDFGWFTAHSVLCLPCLLLSGGGGSYPECHIAQYPLNKEEGMHVHPAHVPYQLIGIMMHYYVDSSRQHACPP